MISKFEKLNRIKELKTLVATEKKRLKYLKNSSSEFGIYQCKIGLKAYKIQLKFLEKGLKHEFKKENKKSK